MKTEQNWNEIWQHFDRLQKRVMYNMTTKEEFFAEDEDKRMDFYEWMQMQCGQYACFM